MGDPGPFLRARVGLWVNILFNFAYFLWILLKGRRKLFFITKTELFFSRRCGQYLRRVVTITPTSQKNSDYQNLLEGKRTDKELGSHIVLDQKLKTQTVAI